MRVCVWSFVCVCVRAVANIALVKPEKARAVEDHIIGLAQKRRLQGAVDLNKLMGILKEMEGQKLGKVKVCFQRVRVHACVCTRACVRVPVCVVCR